MIIAALSAALLVQSPAEATTEAFLQRLQADLVDMFALAGACEAVFPDAAQSLNAAFADGSDSELVAAYEGGLAAAQEAPPTEEACHATLDALRADMLRLQAELDAEAQTAAAPLAAADPS
ncbi:hypothetical protein ACFPIF_09835 [Brevundimonas faecalis]|uniref:hypothetical protein n=1 Tax=Brevundimonas faecalis TaxID=947378 RepID=UPI00360CC70D